VSQEEVKAYWCVCCGAQPPTSAAPHAPPRPAARRKTLSPDARAAALRVPLAELRAYAASVDGSAGGEAFGSAGGGSETPLLDALDAALFRKSVSACRSWREWHCWAPTSTLRLVGCVARARAPRGAGGREKTLARPLRSRRRAG